MQSTTIYTDGACRGNPGPGGWACILKTETAEKELSGGESLTTNNRMELTAVIEGVKACPQGSLITVVTDSTYVMSKKHKKNLDLWAQLNHALKQGKHVLSFKHVYGHSGNPLNERCDRLASQEAENAYIDTLYQENNEYLLDFPEPW